MVAHGVVVKTSVVVPEAGASPTSVVGVVVRTAELPEGAAVAAEARSIAKY